MITFAGRCLLLDIEGTTSSVRYVYDVLFPYAYERMGAFLKQNFSAPDVRAAAEQVARDAGAADLAGWLATQAGADPAEAVAAEALRLMDDDIKATGLKQLQGQIWKGGFEGGALRAHVYPDVPPALRSWTAAGRQVRIYSSGSVEAQRMFFGHTEHGDLLSYFSGHYDTRIGPKREAASYEAIARHCELSAGDLLFLSDIVAELDAARAAGMRTGLLLRPGNSPQPAHDHPAIETFDAITLV